jgi:heptosyltransferase III
VSDRSFENVLVVRTDRIGDVVLTLPMVSVLRERLPNAQISLLLRSYTQELVDGFEGLNQILSYDQAGANKGFFRMLAELRAQKFDLVVVSHPTFRIAALILCARIPTRVGSGYRWYSFLFNRRVFEHRRTAAKHEAEYNISLLQAIGIKEQGVPRVALPISEHSNNAAATVLQNVGIGLSDPFIVLHPGSGGSARDWSADNFGALARRLSEDEFKVVVTGTEAEKALVVRVVSGSRFTALAAPGGMSLKVLAALIGRAQLFISNSTGPLHIAAATGTPVIAFYPPIRECSPQRWGPLTEQKIVFTAENNSCPRCKGGPCQGNDCMDQITVEAVLEAARSLLAHKGQSY